MAALRLFTVLCALAHISSVPCPVAAAPIAATVASPAVARWSVPVEEASARFGIPVSWIERVMMAESGGRLELGGRPIVSRAGAMGLMQLMPETWADMRAQLGLGPDPHDPRGNILAGTLYLRLMYDRFGYPGLFGAYNAGPSRYAAWVAGKGALPAETRAYLARVAGQSPAVPVDRSAIAATTAQATLPKLFFVRKGAAAELKAEVGEAALFVLRGSDAEAK